MCVFKEGSKLSSLKPEFEKYKFNLYAVAHEEFGVDGFKPYFKGEVFLDLDVKKNRSIGQMNDALQNYLFFMTRNNFSVLNNVG